jgi:hypothetical protein
MFRELLALVGVFLEPPLRLGVILGDLVAIPVEITEQAFGVRIALICLLEGQLKGLLVISGQECRPSI